MPRRDTPVTNGQPLILGLDNHAKVSQILKALAGRANLSWYNQEVSNTARNWLRLGMQHMLVASRLASRPRDWRAAVSRCYYAAYNVSKCVRYCVNGFVRFDSTDHKMVGDLPNDFPARASWSTFLVELRQDRNFADYEPWVRTKYRLSRAPSDSVEQTARFIRESKVYLHGRGWI